MKPAPRFDAWPLRPPPNYQRWMIGGLVVLALVGSLGVLLRVLFFRFNRHNADLYGKPGRLVPMFAALVGVFMACSAEARIIGINHTHWAINHFFVDGHSGLDVIGPWQGGGGGHYSPPAKWVPGMTVRIDWETGVGGSKGFPGFADEAKYEAWISKMKAQNRQHSEAALVPEYVNEDVCGITVHFLPCDEIQVTTSCYGYGHPEYPIKTPLKLPEPQSCPQ